MRFDKRILTLWVIIAPLTAGGCVSSTLDSDQFRAVGTQEAVVETNALESEAASASGSNQPVRLTSDVQQKRAVEADLQSSSQTGSPQPEAGATGPDPDARARAVAEMRAKAAAGSGVKTQFGPVPESAAEVLTPREQEALQRELATTASTDVVSDEELAARQRSIELMRRKANSHYRDALKRIER